MVDISHLREGIIISISLSSTYLFRKPSTTSNFYWYRDCVILLSNANTGDEVAVFKGHLDWINSISWSPDGKKLVSCSWDYNLKVWVSGKDKYNGFPSLIEISVPSFHNRMWRNVKRRLLFLAISVPLVLADGLTIVNKFLVLPTMAVWK